MNRALALALVLLALAASGCTAEKKDEGPARPVKFAVIGAPEVGANDDDLALAIGKLSREPDLDFVLVPGPLLAKDATPLSLELLKNDLGQLAPPVYVSFAAVGSGTTALRAEEILQALEKMGPGDEHAIAYTRTPPRASKILVNVVGPDGKSKLEKPPEDKRVISVGDSSILGHSSVGLDDLIVLVAPGPFAARARESDVNPFLHVPPLSSAKQFAIVTIWPARLELQPIALEGANPPGLEPIKLPAAPP